MLVNSGEFDGMKVPEAVEKIIEKLEKQQIGSKKVNYRIRDWLVSRQRYWGVPIPVVFCETCGEVPLTSEKDELPLLLPESTDMEFLKKG